MASSSSLQSPSYGKKNVIIGAVVGGFAAVALLSLGSFVFRRRATRLTEKPINGSSQTFEALRSLQVPLEVPAIEQASELSDPRPWLEMLAIDEPMEMPVNERRAETAVDQRR